MKFYKNREDIPVMRMEEVIAKINDTSNSFNIIGYELLCQVDSYYIFKNLITNEIFKTNKHMYNYLKNAEERRYKIIDS